MSAFCGTEFNRHCFLPFVALDDHGHAAVIGRIRGVAADLEPLRAVAAGLLGAIAWGIHTGDHVLILGHGIDPNCGEVGVRIRRTDTTSKEGRSERN